MENRIMENGKWRIENGENNSQFSTIKSQNKTPQVRFPEFNDDWEHKELNQLLSESKKKNTDLKYGKEEVLSVSGELGIINQIEHLGRSYAGASVHNYGVVEVGDIVYTKSPLKANPYGIIKINKGKAGIVSTLYAVYKVNKKTAYGDFLDYYFSLDANTNRYLRPLVRKGAKNDMKINNEYVLHDRIYAPTIPEQKRIANFFTILDNKINQLKEKKDLLSAYKKGMMQRIFTVSELGLRGLKDDRIENKEQKNPTILKSKKSRFRQLRFKDDNGNDFPEWEVKKLGEEATFFSGGTPTSTRKEYYNGNIPFIKSGEINAVKTEQYLSESGLKNSSAKLVNVGDLLYALYGATSGEVGISKIKGAINQAILCIRTATYNKLFLVNYLIHSKQIIIGTYLQGGQGNLSADIVKGLKILTPIRKEQTKIANFLSKIDDKIKTVNEQIEETKAYKKGLLQKMFIQ